MPTAIRPARPRRSYAPSPDELLAARAAVARLLAARGPLSGVEAAALLDWSLERWWTTVGTADHLFRVTGKGWVVTAEGEQLAGRRPK